MPNHCTIPLTQGKVAIVDPEDYERVSAFRWCTNTKGRSIYARRIDVKGGRKVIYLHRFVLDAPLGTDIDHINRDGLDCRRSNLRFCTNSQNSANKEKMIGCTSRFKGVVWNKDGSNWRARVSIKGKLTHLGCFADEADAARTYDSAALQAFGEFAHLNFPVS